METQYKLNQLEYIMIIIIYSLEHNLKAIHWHCLLRNTMYSQYIVEYHNTVSPFKLKAIHLHIVYDIYD